MQGSGAPSMSLPIAKGTAQKNNTKPVHGYHSSLSIPPTVDRACASKAKPILSAEGMAISRNSGFLNIRKDCRQGIHLNCFHRSYDAMSIFPAHSEILEGPVHCADLIFERI